MAVRVRFPSEARKTPLESTLRGFFIFNKGSTIIARGAQKAISSISGIYHGIAPETIRTSYY